MINLTVLSFVRIVVRFFKKWKNPTVFASSFPSGCCVLLMAQNPLIKVAVFIAIFAQEFGTEARGAEQRKM